MPEKIIRVQLIVDPGNAGWILEKIALRLEEMLISLGCEVEILSNPSGNSDVVFWIYFGHKGILAGAGAEYSTRLKSAFVTHVDDSAKLNKIKKLYQASYDLVFMSPSSASEINVMLGISEISFNILLGSDFASGSQSMRIGLFSKCFPDGRKNEEWLIKLAHGEDLTGCDFIFVGTGWELVRNALEASGARVELHDGIQYPYPPYAEFKQFYKSLDLYIYPGFDGGGMGSLDAYILGTQMLISDDGYHKDFLLNDDSYFANYGEFRDKFMFRLNSHRNHVKHLEKWTWSYCASSLLEHWESLLSQQIEKQIPKIVNPSAFRRSLQSRTALSVYSIYKIRSVKRLLFIRIPGAIMRRVKAFLRY